MACIQSIPAMFLLLHMSVVCWLHLCCEWCCINTDAKLQHTVHHPLYSNYTVCQSSSDLHTWLYGCMKMLFRSRVYLRQAHNWNQRLKMCFLSNMESLNGHNTCKTAASCIPFSVSVHEWLSGLLL